MNFSVLNMRFSVLISVYEKENPAWFDLAMDSIWNQSLKPDEVVLVKDGPLTPGLETVLAKWNEKFGERMKTVALGRNAGLAAALNAGLQACRSEWVARMDTDDICLPNRLETLARFIGEHPGADIVGSWALRLDEHGQAGKVMKVPADPVRIRRLIWSCPLIHPTVCFKREKILAVGGYNLQAGPRQDDYELWFRCAAAGHVFYNIPEPLLLYRFTDMNIRRNTLKVGYHRMKNGWKGNRMLGAGPLAYLWVMVPFFRGMLPYPLNVWVYRLLDRLNPRGR
jgi:glycosyltransferase involved in cell wall biosynthesis